MIERTLIPLFIIASILLLSYAIMRSPDCRNVTTVTIGGAWVMAGCQ